MMHLRVKNEFTGPLRGLLGNAMPDARQPHRLRQRRQETFRNPWLTRSMG
jgi:hypothetical protein